MCCAGRQRWKWEMFKCEQIYAKTVKGYMGTVYGRSKIYAGTIHRTNYWYSRD